MLARLGREAGAGIGHLDHHHRALAPAGDADLVARRIVRRARFQRLHRIAREIDQHAQQLVGVGIDDQAALDGDDPADLGFRRSASVSCTSSTSASTATGLRSGGGSCTRP